MQPNIIERVWRQDKMVNVDVLNGFTFTDEEEAHRFIISGKNVNTPVVISGTITANFKNADGVLVPLTGTIEDGKAVVVLSQECYAVEGPFSLMIFADTVCIYAAIANVINSSGETIAYPTATIPSVQELIEEVQDAIASIPQDYSALNQSVTDLKSAVTQVNDGVLNSSPTAIFMENGSFSSFNPGDALTKSGNAKNRLRSKQPIVLPCDTIISAKTGIQFETLFTNTNGIITRAVAYRDTLAVIGDSTVSLVLKKTDGTDFSSTNIFDWITLYPITNTSEVKYGEHSIPFEFGTLTNFGVGQAYGKEFSETYHLSRLRTANLITLSEKTVIKAKSGFLFNVLHIVGGNVYSASGYVDEVEIENEGLYSIVIKASDDSSIFTIDADLMVDVIAPTLFGNGIGVVLEYGSFKSFAINTAIEKQNQNVNRVRTYSAINLPAYTQIKTANNYQVGILEDKGDGTLKRGVVYYTDYVLVNPSKVWFVVKHTNDNDIGIITPDIVTVKQLANPFDKGASWATPIPDGNYIPIVQPDVSVFNRNANMDVLIDAWNALATNHDDYLTLTNLGKDASGIYDLIRVDATGGRYSRNTVKRPKVIISACQHGSETEAGYALYYLFKDIAENWRQNAVLEYLRWNVDFVMMPMVNPYGSSASTRSYYNYNGVNINHNFDDTDHRIGYGEDADDAGHPEYHGPNAFSEVEAQKLKALIDGNTDAVLYIDFHQMSSNVPLNPGQFTYHDLDPFYKSKEYVGLMVDSAIRHIDWVNIKYPDDYDLDVSPNTNYGSVVYNTLGGHSYSYAMSVGVYGHVVECPPNLPGQYETTDMYSAENLTAAIRTFGEWIQMALVAIYGETH